MALGRSAAVVALVVAGLVVAGHGGQAEATTRAIAHLDRDGDGRADLVVLRYDDMNGGWTWYWQRSSKGYQTHTCCGSDTWPVIGDWDGDRIVDHAVWVPDFNGDGQGLFAIQQTSVYRGFTPTQYWGEPGDDPTVIADYNGDGRTDTAVYRPGAPSTWFISPGNTSDMVVQWGEADDVPTPGDYDGDGRADIAVARPSGDGTWHWFIRLSHGGVRVVQFGDVDDYIVPGDFDGDGRTDLAVTRDTNGVLTWYILGSSSGFRSLQFGNTATDYEVADDYDGDGRTDIAVWREESPGRFFILNSSTGRMRVEAWGEPGDLPLAYTVVRAAPTPP